MAENTLKTLVGIADGIDSNGDLIALRFIEVDNFYSDDMPGMSLEEAYKAMERIREVSCSDTSPA